MTISMIVVVVWCLCAVSLIPSTVSAANEQVVIAGAIVEPICSIPLRQHSGWGRRVRNGETNAAIGLRQVQLCSSGHGTGVCTERRPPVQHGDGSGVEVFRCLRQGKSTRGSGTGIADANLPMMLRRCFYVDLSSRCAAVASKNYRGTKVVA